MQASVFKLLLILHNLLLNHERFRYKVAYKSWEIPRPRYIYIQTENNVIEIFFFTSSAGKSSKDFSSNSVKKNLMATVHVQNL